MTYGDKMDFLKQSVREFEIASNEYMQFCKSDCDENCTECTRRVMLGVLRKRFDMVLEDLNAVWATVSTVCLKEADE